MRGFRDWLRHAFAVEAAPLVAPTPEEQQLLDDLCQRIVAAEFTAPALICLESCRPLNYVGAQALHFFEPFTIAFAHPDTCRRLATYLERRGSVEWFIMRLEELARQHTAPPSVEASSALSQPANPAGFSPAQETRDLPGGPPATA